MVVRLAKVYTKEEVEIGYKIARLERLREDAEILFAIVESGSTTPHDDCRDAWRLLGSATENLWTEHPRMSWFADSIHEPLHRIGRWKTVPLTKLLVVTDRTIALLDMEIREVRQTLLYEQSRTKWV